MLELTDKSPPSPSKRLNPTSRKLVVRAILRRLGSAVKLTMLFRLDAAFAVDLSGYQPLYFVGSSILSMKQKAMAKSNGPAQR